jgi:copper transport protein
MQVMIGGDGRGVPSTRVSRVDGLEGGVPPQNEGTYVVRWQVIASDTHPSRGQYTFSVGHPSAAAVSENQDVGAVAPAGLLLQAVARWLHFLGLALSVGVIAYMVFVGSGSGRLDRLVIAGIGLLVAAEPVAVAGQALSLGVVAGDLLASSFGRVVGLRLGGALLFWAVLGAVDRAAQGRAALLVLGAILMLVDGAAGHRIVGLPDVATFGLGAVHEAAMAVWVGGLIAVLVTRSGGARFARFALGSFGVLGVSGALMAFTHLRAPGDLLFSIYGAVLVVKVLTVAAAAVIAALRARRLEAMALAAILFLAGLLVSLPPPR